MNGCFKKIQNHRKSKFGPTLDSARGVDCFRDFIATPYKMIHVSKHLKFKKKLQKAYILSQNQPDMY